MNQQDRIEPLSWTAKRGNAWAELQPLLDRLFLPIEQWIADGVAVEDAREVLDVGCGAGATSLAIARRLSTSGRCTGIDISAALIGIARRIADEAALNNLSFVTADAQSHDFGTERYDSVVSRFGMMFFDDPVAAFANIGSAVLPGGLMNCVAWRGPGDNPFMAVADNVIAPIVGMDHRPDPHAPGQFAFADAQRVETILASSGWEAIDIQPLDLPCAMPTADLAIYIRRMGRVGTILPTLVKEERREVEAQLDAAFAPFVAHGVARFDAACWAVRARRPA